MADTAALPPQDLSAEQATLGSVLVDPSAALIAMNQLDQGDFYSEAHQVVFRAMRAVLSRNEPVDLVTVGAELRRTNELERAGGPEYLMALINSVPTAAHVARYANLVWEKSLLRKLIAAGAEIQALAYDNPAAIGEAMDAAEKKIFEIAQRRTSSDFVPLKPLVEETFVKLDQAYHKPGFMTGVPTSLRDLDQITRGLQPGDLIIVAGRPSMGKTSLAIANLAVHAAVQHQLGVGVFSLEMSDMQLAEMMLCSYARVNPWDLRRGGPGRDEEWAAVGRAIGTLSKAPIFIDATPGIPILELRSKARRLKAQHDIGLLVVDYLQLVTTGMTNSGENRHQEVSLIARSLKSLSRELNVPVVALSQLSRRVEQREDRRPILSDLAESGSIEAEADLVCFLYREGYYARKKALQEAEKRGEAAGRRREEYNDPDQSEIIVAKHRNGPTGTVKTTFNPRFRRFFDTDQTRRGDEAY
ncbi:MAG: replicative DNA helicase [candidate division WS1 bacterium]|nr:replicative DNA helicase [candidate division WS1 bacterium]